MRKLSCWVVTDGKPGMENQCLGLAEAMDLEPEVKRVRLRPPWRDLSPYVRWLDWFAVSALGDSIAPPWPDILIGTGRQSIVPSVMCRRRSHGRTFTIQVQDPVVRAGLFDLVVVPEHDRLRGRNVLVTRGALNRVTSKRLERAATRHAAPIAALPHPRVAVLIGGSNAAYQLTPTVTGDLADQLVQMSRGTGAALMVTASRRTGADNEAILRARLRDVPSLVWDGAGENPYFSFLAHADAIIVTSDSVSMVSEACATGKPVHVVMLDGGSRKFDAFHASLTDAGITRRFNGRLEFWSYEPLRETERIAAEIRSRLADRPKDVPATIEPASESAV